MQIKQEFKNLIPALTADEFKQLEANIIKEGIREKILTWQGFIIDGHNRYEIAKKHNLEYKTQEMNFNSEDEVKLFMIDNQAGRRNLTDGWKFELQNAKRDILLKKGAEIRQETQGRPTNTEKLLSFNDNSLKHDTRQIIANNLNWSSGKTAQAEQVWKKSVSAEIPIQVQEVAKEVKQKVLDGEMTIGEAYKEIKAVEKKEDLLIKKEEYKQVLNAEIKDKRPLIYKDDCINFLSKYEDDSFDLLITDPPYSTDIENIEEFAEKWVLLALQKIKKNGRAYICTGAYPTEMLAYLNVFNKQTKFKLDNPLIWTYKNTLGITPKMKYNLNYQVIWHLYSEASNELDTSITNEMFNVMEINAPDGRLGNRLHTWQKPDELALRLIKHSTQKNDKIIDCFACTGTFLLMSAKLERDAIGCDIDLNNIQIAIERGCKYESL